MKKLIINKTDLIHNIETIQNVVNKDNYRIIAVVKGDRLWPSA